MHLREYIFKNHMTIKEFAEKCNYSPVAIRGVIKGRYKISPKLARAIERASNGFYKASQLEGFTYEY